MKKTLKNIFLLTAFLTIEHLHAQATFSVGTAFCYDPVNTANNAFNAAIVTTVSATSYSWSGTLIGNSSVTLAGSYFNATIPAATYTLPSCGVYSLVCSAYNGTVLAYTAANTVTSVCTNWLTTSNSGSTTACYGSSVTLSAINNSGISSFSPTYSWSDGSSIISTSATAVVAPTANTCYTLTASNFCPGTAVNCVTFTSTPTMNVYSSYPSPYCSNSSATLSASSIGISSYTWTSFSSTVSGTSSLVATPGCYTVTGTTAAGCSASTVVCVTSPITGPITVLSPASGSVCLGNSATLTAVGGSNYTWTAVASGAVLSNSATAVVSPTSTSSTYSVSALNVFGCPATNSVTLYLAPAPPTISVSASSPSTCQSGSVSMTASGANTYTWYPGGFTGASQQFYPPISICYTIVGNTSAACSGSATSCVNLVPSPTLAITGNSIMCQGSAQTLSVSGAQNYTWSTGSTASSILISPQASNCYSLTGTDANGCSSIKSICVFVQPSPTVVITGNTTMCQGATQSLTASGASSYIWSTTSTAPSILINPQTSTCYSVSGTGPNGCTGDTTLCIQVQPAVLLVGPALSQTVCKGSSATFTASGANTYTWSTAIFTPTINLLPSTSSSYSIAGTDANGCIGTSVVAVMVDTTCTNVWPGDANNDGIVDNTDAFELGLAYGNSGAARIPGGNAYVGQYATDWAGTVSTGKNKCNADCNGDGIINNGDTLAIFNNYSLTHAFKPMAATSVADITPIATQDLTAGTWNKVDIQLGDIQNQVVQLYGVAYSIDFDQSLMQPDSVYLIYTASFLNASNQNILFRKTVFGPGKMYTASVREDGVNVSGNGKIAELWFKLKTGLADNTPLNVSIFDAKKTDRTGLISTLTPGSASMTVSSIATGIKNTVLSENTFGFFPNPASNQLTMASSISTNVNYTVLDITGRELLSGNFAGSKTVDLSGFANGPYVIKFASAASTFYKKLVIEH